MGGVEPDGTREQVASWNSVRRGDGDGPRTPR